MSIEHKDIPEAGLHEPKGVSTAASGTVYVADGAGSGSWSSPVISGQESAPVDTIPVSNGSGGIVWTPVVHLARSHIVNGSQAIPLTGASIRSAGSYTDVTQYLTQILVAGELTFGASNRVIVAEDGYYDITCWLSISSSVTSATIALSRTVNGVSQVATLAASLYKSKAAGDVATLNNSTVSFLTAGTQIGYAIASDTTTTLTLTDGMFKVVKVSL